LKPLKNAPLSSALTHERVCVAHARKDARAVQHPPR